ncbi:PLP-dependent aminotransferase family protein [Microbacterium sp. zg.Y1090]|uniref:aminotransferase-like domain-containing protein n=1 Tax=Microbacterium wangruii TaxID=3049073 RepID=UPI00214AB836|nr:MULTISPECIES: PLP-dependent aminotransferase family protein [unclassified Microbacterium]MCR2817362.1 PLP-dependent aminotransferase family protein [Microbacterium sp. zg.Y1090]WIM29151.1 PLP-dependent aminotransferase family protein [Microbacterium sp. zg-Y1090]
MNDSSSARIAADLAAWLASAPPGARLPSTRELAARHAASPVTVQSALRSLTARGLIETRPGVGTFVAAARRARPQDYSWQTGSLGAAGQALPTTSAALRATRPDAIALHSGYPDRELLPERLVRAAVTRATRSDAALQRSDSAGSTGLRVWFASELAAQTPAQITPPSAQDVIVLPGSQLGLGALFRSIAGSRNTMLIESPTYWGAILAARQVGVTLIPIPTGTDGPDLDALDRAFSETGARGFYAQPNYANPTGAQWSRLTGDTVLKIVRSHRAFLIEDDWAHDFGITTDAVPLAARDDSGHVVYLRSLTKSISPAIRVAAVIARGPIRTRLLSELQAQSMYVSGLLQAAALDVVSQPGWQTHRRALRKQLRHRRDLLVDALTSRVSDATIASVPPGGLNLWVRLPDTVDLDRLVQDAEARGLAIAGGDEWFPAEPAGRYLRLNFAGPDPAGFEQAAILLDDSLAAQR